MILSKSCPLSRLSKHCHSEPTAPFIDQRWLQEPCLVSDLQGVLHPSRTMFLWGHSRKKDASQKCGGGGVWVLSMNFPKPREWAASVTWSPKNPELSDSRTHRSQPEMKVLSTLNKQGCDLAAYKHREHSFISELPDSPVTDWPIFLPALWGTRAPSLLLLPAPHEGRKPKHTIVVTTTGSFTLQT